MGCNLTKRNGHTVFEYYCDHCGKKSFSAFDFVSVVFGLGETFDLCADCEKEIKKFFEGGNDNGLVQSATDKI